MRIGRPKELRSALLDSLAIEVVLGLIGGLVVDGGVCFQVWAFSVAAFWGGCALVLTQRWQSPTEADLVMIRWGLRDISADCNGSWPQGGAGTWPTDMVASPAWGDSE